MVDTPRIQTPTHLVLLFDLLGQYWLQKGLLLLLLRELLQQIQQIQMLGQLREH